MKPPPFASRRNRDKIILMVRYPRFRIPWLTLAILAVIAASVWFVIRDITEYVTSIRPSLIFTELRVRVYKNQRPHLEFTAGKVTVSQNQTDYEIDNLKRGILRRKEKPPFRFSAKHGAYNTRTEDLVVDTPVEFKSVNGDYFHAGSASWQGARKILNVEDKVAVGLDGNTYSADSLEGQGEDIEFVSLKGNVRAFLPDIEESGSEKIKTEIKEAEVEKKQLANFTLRANEMRYDGNRKELFCMPLADRPIFVPREDLGEAGEKHYVLMDTERFEMKSRELFVQFEHKFVNLNGDVWIRRKAEKPDSKKSKLVQSLQKRDAVFMTAEATYHWQEKRVDVPSAVSMKQASLDGAAGSATIHSTNEWSRFEKGVILHQRSGEWLLKDGVVKKDSPEKTKKVARAETTLRSETALVNFDTDDISATGSVSILQKKRSLKGDSAVYSSDTKTWRVLGSPIAVDEDNTLAADIFIIDEERERFLALGAARSVFLPDEDDRENLDDFFRERDGESETRKRYEKDKVVVVADLLDHNEKDKTLDASGDVVVTYRDITFAAPKMRIDYDEKTIAGSDGTLIKDKYSETTSATFLADWGSHDATLTGGVNMKHKGRGATKEKKEIDPFTIVCEKLEYNWKSKKGAAAGNPVITSKGRQIASDRAAFDAEAGKYDFHGGVKMHQDDGNWLSEKGYIDKEEDERAWKIARDAADAACDEAHFDEENDFFRLAGRVVVEQKDRRMESDWLELSGKVKRFAAGGRVHLFQTKGDWLFEADLLGEDDDEDVKERAKGRIDIYADLLESNYGEKKLYLEGEVFAKQDQSTFEGDRVWHDDKAKITKFEGNVRINDEKGRSLSAEAITYDGKEKVFEARRKVAGAGYIEKKK